MFFRIEFQSPPVQPIPRPQNFIQTPVRSPYFSGFHFLRRSDSTTPILGREQYLLHRIGYLVRAGGKINFCFCRISVDKFIDYCYITQQFFSPARDVEVAEFDTSDWLLQFARPGKSLRVSSVLLGMVLAGRATFVFPLSFLSNFAKKSPNEKINFKKQITIWWAGLMRGAVSIALAYNQFKSSGHNAERLRGSAIMITSTISVVLFSIMALADAAEEKQKLEANLSSDGTKNIFDIEHDPIAEVFGSDKKKNYYRAISSS